MRAQFPKTELNDMTDMLNETLKKLAPRPLVFYIAVAFLIIYSFVMTQGVSPEEIIGGQKIAETICENLEMISVPRITNLPETYAIQQLCTNFVCRTRTLTADDANKIFLSVYSCDSDEDEAFNQFVGACSEFCAKGFIDVRSAAKTISYYVGGAFGKPDYCIFLKKGPMASVLLPRCTDGLTYTVGGVDQPVNLCMKGFSCYLYGPGAPDIQCGCDQLYDFQKASEEYLGENVNMSSASYSSFYTKFSNTDELSCGDDVRVDFTADDPSKIEWWFRHRAFPPETDNIDWNTFISNKFPKPICMVTFGLLPFVILFFLLKDTIMYFVPVRDDLKEIVALFIALLSLLFGTFDNIVLLITKLAGWTISPQFSFIVIMLVSAVFGAISNQIMAMLIQRRETNRRIIEFAGSLGELGK